MPRSLLILTVILLHANINSACNDNYELSNCCESNNSCESQSNCCQTSGSRCRKQCCQNSCRSCFNTCNAGCRTETCASRCTHACCNSNQNCCDSNQNCNDNNKIVSTTEKSVTVVVTSVDRSQPNRNQNQNSQIQNINNDTIQTTLNLRNEVSIVNNITVPIIIQNENKINVRIAEITNESSESIQYTTPSVTTPKSSFNNTIVDRIPVLIPIPSKPIYISTPTPVVIPQPVRQPGCCLTFTPCLHNDRCSPYQQSCGQHCLYQYQYQPSNPCLEKECQKRQFVPAWSCQFGYCQASITNCNRCDDNSFYKSFNSYRQCGGCYYR